MKQNPDILLEQDYNHVIEVLSSHTKPNRETVYTLLVIYGHSEEKVKEYLNAHPV